MQRLSIRSIHRNAETVTNSECNRCGRNGHAENSMNCPERNMKCNKCSRVGHFVRKFKTNMKRQVAENYNLDPKQWRTRIRAINDKNEVACFKILSDDEIDYNLSYCG